MSEPYRINKIQENWSVVIAIMFIASTLRAPLTSVGPVVNEIIKELKINDSIAGSLTTIPLIIFAIISPLVSKVTSYLTISRTLLLLTILLGIALIVRVAGDFNIFLIGTILLGVAIAFGNVLLPSYVKWYFPTQIGIATGMYSAMMHFTGGLGGGLSVPLSTLTLFNFRLSLSIWIILAALAMLLWLPKMKKSVKLEKSSVSDAQIKSHCNIKVFNSKLAWMIALTMGFQSMMVYSVVAWVPAILINRGLDPTTAGYLFMINQFAQVPMTFIFPIIAARLKEQRILVVIITALFLIGFSFLFAHNLVLLIIGIIIAGLAMGACFSLCMTFFSIRARTSDGSISLSGFGQSVGYLIGAIGPIFMGFLFDATGNWNAGIIFLLIMPICFLIFGYGASKDKVIEDA